MINAWTGAVHLLTRRLNNVKSEISLKGLAYHLKRVITILGAKPLMAAVQV